MTESSRVRKEHVDECFPTFFISFREQFVVKSATMTSGNVEINMALEIWPWVNKSRSYSILSTQIDKVRDAFTYISLCIYRMLLTFSAKKAEVSIQNLTGGQNIFVNWKNLMMKNANVICMLSVRNEKRNHTSVLPWGFRFPYTVTR